MISYLSIKGRHDFFKFITFYPKARVARDFLRTYSIEKLKKLELGMRLEPMTLSFLPKFILNPSIFSKKSSIYRTILNKYRISDILRKYSTIVVKKRR